MTCTPPHRPAQSSSVCHDMASRTDYRRLAQHTRGLYFVSPSRDVDLYEAFVQSTHGQPLGPRRIDVMMGRSLEVPVAAGRCGGGGGTTWLCGGYHVAVWGLPRGCLGATTCLRVCVGGGERLVVSVVSIAILLGSSGSSGSSWPGPGCPCGGRVSRPPMCLRVCKEVSRQ